jgi:DNA-binding transcriptional MerR regulator
MAPRPGLEADDIVTPSQAAALLGVPASTVRTWIARYRLQSLGRVGRWNVYDFRDIAQVEASLTQRDRETPKAGERALRLVPAA